MTTDTFDPAATPLTILAEAMSGRTLPAARRMIAAEDNHNPAEGLALLGAYTAIGDREIRQAILDTLAVLAS